MKQNFCPLVLTILLLGLPVTSSTASAPAGATESQSLDGPWQIVFDPANEGGAKQWVRGENFPREQGREIAVPSCWELFEKDYEGVAFYRRAFTVPKGWQGKVVRLQFDAVNFRAEVWLNDTAVGFHEGGFTPLEFRVDDLLKFDGENTLIVRMIEAVRCNPNVAGYCIHALTAGDWIIGAGLLDLWRNPKTYAYEATKAASQPRILSIRVRPRNVYAERGTTIEVTGVNETTAVKGNLKLQLVAGDGAVVSTRTIRTDLPSGITRLFTESPDTQALQGTYTVRAEIDADDGSLIAQNAYNFDVFAVGQLAVPKHRIAVLDPSNSLKPFLKQAGIEFVEFVPEIDHALPVFVSRSEAKTPEQRKRFGELAAFIKAGGTAVYLQGGGAKAPWGVGGKASSLLPVDASLKQAVGTWTCIPHLVKDHPVFDGLPVNGMMGAIYENVWAEGTLLGVGGETIVASIGYDWYPNLDLSRRHYYGPGDTWWAADMAIVPLGKGRHIVSQLRLVENLGKDPVADKILYNLIESTID